MWTWVEVDDSALTDSKIFGGFILFNLCNEGYLVPEIQKFWGPCEGIGLTKELFEYMLID